MAYFQTKKSKFWVNLGGSYSVRGCFILLPFGLFCCQLVYFMAIWYILWPFGIFYGHLVYCMAIWHILLSLGIFCCHLVYFSRFVMLHLKYISGNPDSKSFFLRLSETIFYFRNGVLPLRGEHKIEKNRPFKARNPNKLFVASGKNVA
jgi:hypothetical protein